MMPAVAGGLMGGLLGQAGEALGAPRRILMDTLGLPQEGSALLEQLFGVDPNSMGGQLGGVATEMATDPLSYAGFLGGSLAPLFGDVSKADRLADATRLGGAAEAAAAANQAAGKGLGVEKLARTGAAVAADDVAAAGPRVGLYARDMQRPRTGIEALSTVPDDIRFAKGKPSASPRKAKAAARQGIMDANATANDDMLTKALASYGDPYQGDTFALPGMMMPPGDPLRGNPLAMMNPQDAMQGISPLIQALQSQATASGRLSPLEIAAILGTGAGAIGGGVYAGM